MGSTISFTLKKVKWSRYRPGVAQRVGRGIALLFHDRGTRRWWVVSSTPWSHLTPGKDPVPILQEAGWAPGPVWTGGKSRPHWDSIPNRPALCQSLYRLSYPAHIRIYYIIYIYIFFHGVTAPNGLGSHHYRGFKITLRHTTLGRIPLDERSARRRETSTWQHLMKETDLVTETVWRAE